MWGTLNINKVSVVSYIMQFRHDVAHLMIHHTHFQYQTVRHKAIDGTPLLSIGLLTHFVQCQ